jgi:8-hydroxy-5-deazaflavin:NADPH oxidoreductase
LARAEISAVISKDSWAEDSLSGLIADLKGLACATTLEAAAEEDVVFLSVRWSELAETLAAVADWESRILIDATDPMLPGSEPADTGEMTSSEIVRDLSPGAQLVKAFSGLSPAALAADPKQGGGRRVVFLAGDHVRAKIETSRLVRQMGYAAVDLGALASGGKLLQFPHGALWGKNLVSVEL